MIDGSGGMSALLVQARELEKDRSIAPYIEVIWRDLGNDIKELTVSPEAVPLLCALEGIEDPRRRQLRHMEKISGWRERAEGVPWLLPFYDGILRRLEAGQRVRNIDLDDEGYFAYIHEAAVNREPVYERIFSGAVCAMYGLLGGTAQAETPSKLFQNRYRSAVLRVLREWSDLAEEGMSDEEVLTAHGILTYAQTLELKGPLEYRIGDGAPLSTAEQTCGAVLNSQTLEKARPTALPGVRRIVTIENKANYEKLPFSEDTLYLYCHGFFSPRERGFLEKLMDLAGEETEYLHWGDMDFGGIRIFLFHQKALFPKLKPWKMGRKDFEEAKRQGGAVPLEASKRAALEKLDAGALEDLKACILENDLEIEQELLLAGQWMERRAGS